MPEWTVYAMASLLMLLVSLVVRRNKSGSLIAGYNTMTEQEKATWNVDVLRRYVALLLALSAVLFLASAVALFCWPGASDTVAGICWPVFVMGMFAGVLYANVSRRFRAG